MEDLILRTGIIGADGGRFTALILSDKERYKNPDATNFINELMQDEKVDTILYGTVSPAVLQFLYEYIKLLEEMIDEKDSLLAEYIEEEEKRENRQNG